MNMLKSNCLASLVTSQVGLSLTSWLLIDFTASNGHPRSSDSLYYIDPSGRLNAYQQLTGVEGIMAAYASTLYHVSLSGPTLFGPVTSKAAEIAGHSLSLGHNIYFVLLIITDLDHGVISDTQETIDSSEGFRHATFNTYCWSWECRFYANGDPGFCQLSGSHCTAFKITVV